MLGDVTRRFTNSEQTEWNLLQEHSFAYAGCNHFASPRFLLDALPSPALRSLLTVGTCFDRSWGVSCQGQSRKSHHPYQL